MKRTQATSSREIELALKRAKEISEMTKLADLHKKWMNNENYRKAYDALAPEFALARAVLNENTVTFEDIDHLPVSWAIIELSHSRTIRTYRSRCRHNLGNRHSRLRS